MWMATFGRRQPLVENDPQWKMTFSGRHLQWKTTFGGRQPLVEDNLWWKKTFGGRRPSIEDDLRCILACCLLRFATFFLNLRKGCNKEGGGGMELKLMMKIVLHYCYQ